MYQDTNTKVSFLRKINKTLDYNQILDVFFKCEKHTKNILLALENYFLMKKIKSCFDSSDFFFKDKIDSVLQILMVVSQTHYL